MIPGSRRSLVEGYGNPLQYSWASHGVSEGKESTCNAGDLGSTPACRRSPGEGKGYPLQYSWASPGGSEGKESACNAGDLGGEDPLEEGMPTHPSILAWRIPMDRGAWRAAVHRVTKTQT